MCRSNKIKWKTLIISVLISLGVGGLSALLTGNNMEIYKTLNLPALAPPGIVFPIVWSVLYILMGISAYLIYTERSTDKGRALLIYAVQLVVNMLWSPIFFRGQAFLFAFIWLVLLWVLIILMIWWFSKINRTAALLPLPYLLWVTFAGYLNLGIYLLNRHPL